MDTKTKLMEMVATLRGLLSNEYGYPAAAEYDLWMVVSSLEAALKEFPNEQD